MQSLAEDLSDDKQLVIFFSTCLEKYFLCLSKDKAERERLSNLPCRSQDGNPSSNPNSHSASASVGSPSLPKLKGLKPLDSQNCASLLSSGASGDPSVTLVTLPSERQARWLVFMNVKLNHMKHYRTYRNGNFIWFNPIEGSR